MKNHTQQSKQNRSISARAPYIKPTVKEFGSVGTLTQSGTGPGNEMSTTTMSMV